MTIKELQTQGADQQNYTFYFNDNPEIEDGLHKFRIFDVQENAVNGEGVFFQFDVDRINDEEVRVDTMSNGGHSNFSAKGIPDAMILFVREKFQARVYSSTNHSDYKRRENESRNKLASKVWRRLLLIGEASFCETSFRYYTFDSPVPSEDLNIQYDKCTCCSFQAPTIDYDLKIEHCTENHLDQRTQEDKTPLEFAKRLFYVTQGQRRRQNLFTLFTKNLNLLVDNKLIEAEKDKYICPICLEVHEATEAETNPLTLEDAPPKSLGGKANTLTCERCNGHCGRNIDHHITNRLQELDSANLIPGTKTKVKVNINGDIFQSTISVEEDGTMIMEHSKKNNNPKKLEPTMEKLKGGQKIDMNFLESKVIPENIEYALLKTGYMLAFEKFGYSLMLDECYDVVRNQILKPEKRIYPESFWTKQPFPKEHCGVYFVLEKGAECILTIFQLHTKFSTSTFCVFLPTPIRPINEVIHNLKGSFGNSGGLKLSLVPPPGTSIDYLNDINNIQAMKEWIEKRTDVA